MNLFLLADAPATPHGTPSERAQSLFGLLVFTSIAFLIGRLRGSRARLPVRTIVWGFILQFAFGAIVLFAPAVLEPVQLAIQKLLDFSNAGAMMLFGEALVNGGIAKVTNDPAGQGTVMGFAQIGFVFAITVL